MFIIKLQQIRDIIDKVIFVFRCPVFFPNPRSEQSRTLMINSQSITIYARFATITNKSLICFAQI